MAELETGLDSIRRSPPDRGVLEMIVCRPATGQREIMEEAVLNPEEGLVGDTWKQRGGLRGPDTDRQLTIMNARAVALLAQDKSRWPQAGDQLYIDFDLSERNAPPGTQLAIGSAVIEITTKPHTGCKKFVERFGLDAMKFVNSDTGMELHLRGVNAKVVTAGNIRTGDAVRKLTSITAGS